RPNGDSTPSLPTSKTMAPDFGRAIFEKESVIFHPVLFRFLPARDRLARHGERSSQQAPRLLTPNGRLGGIAAAERLTAGWDTINRRPGTTINHARLRCGPLSCGSL